MITENRSVGGLIPCSAPKKPDRVALVSLARDFLGCARRWRTKATKVTEAGKVVVPSPGTNQLTAAVGSDRPIAGIESEPALIDFPFDRSIERGGRPLKIEVVT